MSTADPNGLSSIERHGQSLVAVLIVGLIVWVGATVNRLQTDVAAMQADLRNLTLQMADLRTDTRRRYTKADAERDIGLLIDRNRVLAANLRALRKRVDAIERNRTP